MLGEAGTEQFTITTRVNGQLIREQRIHDPFIRSKTVTRVGFIDRLKQLFCPQDLVVEVCIDGSHGATSAVMMLDTNALEARTRDFLDQQRARREANGSAGHYSNAMAISE